jgi:hypothetical protein
MCFPTVCFPGADTAVAELQVPAHERGSGAGLAHLQVRQTALQAEFRIRVQLSTI